MDKALEQLVEAVKQASPALWAAAQHKVQAEMLDAFVGMAFAVLVFWIARRIEGHLGRIESDEGLEGGLAIVGRVVACLAMFVAAFAFFSCASSLGQRVVAQDWFAIKALADLSPLK